MRTTVNVSDDVLKDLMSFTEAKTRTEAVNRAVAEWVRRQRIERLKRLRGKLRFSCDIEELRALEIDEARALDD